jgi:hypothetical protein
MVIFSPCSRSDFNPSLFPAVTAISHTLVWVNRLPQIGAEDLRRPRDDIPLQSEIHQAVPNQLTKNQNQECCAEKSLDHIRISYVRCGFQRVIV